MPFYILIKNRLLWILKWIFSSNETVREREREIENKTSIIRSCQWTLVYKARSYSELLEIFTILITWLFNGGATYRKNVITKKGVLNSHSNGAKAYKKFPYAPSGGSGKLGSKFSFRFAVCLLFAYVKTIRFSLSSLSFLVHSLSLSLFLSFSFS